MFQLKKYGLTSLNLKRLSNGVLHSRSSSTPVINTAVLEHLLYVEEQAGGPRMKMRFEISEWKENEAVALRMVSGLMMKSYEQFWKLEPTPSGSRINFSEHIDFSLGVIGKLLDSIEGKASVGTIDKMLVKLKSLVEA